MGDIIRNGVIMLVIEFIILCMYIFISSPFDDMVTSFENINGSTDAEVEAGGSQARTMFNMMFAGFALIPPIWFMIWVFVREPDRGFKP